ncbi:hypothetical protein [Acinetobacter proteolyticus]|uniref:hypothetical protein n=1 Tax=Acinetobacter proteolyticus TaxID=1776741 RepID=UPI0012FEC8F1|nr:hypothetical protein [Acinetobacter proteolyticus]
MKLDYQSFKPDGFNKNRDQVGTVLGSLDDQPIVCRAYQSTNGDLTVAGFIGKYKMT